jgi:hypothetical protein
MKEVKYETMPADDDHYGAGDCLCAADGIGVLSPDEERYGDGDEGQERV